MEITQPRPCVAVHLSVATVALAVPGQMGNWGSLGGSLGCGCRCIHQAPRCYLFQRPFVSPRDLYLESRPGCSFG